MDFQQRIVECGRMLGRCGKEHFRRFGTQIQKLRSRLDILRDSREQQAVNDYMAMKTSTTSDILNRVASRVTEEMNASLLLPFTMAEFKSALFLMAPEKVPGPDGTQRLQYRLDSEKKVPNGVADLRPIALYNVAYKTINGQHHRCRGSGSLSEKKIKQDDGMDRLETRYGQGVRLDGMGLPGRNINGDSAGTIHPTCGIQQGDPLSPYLFILCAKGLSIFLRQAEARGDIHGVRIARGAPSVSHLFFADDSLLFFRANKVEAQKIKDCLEVYSAALVQVINYEKSNSMFSSNTDSSIRTAVTECVGVRETTDLGRYLGLPSVLGRNKLDTFQFIEQKV
ncbi:PREDICTED: uncharacterized protein LOC109191677 [Ipomoea nil]|uniref:uncharacterized protein LOC109191677 n=1 Tax=Ipomoea nil TaxID=35883 RepID=UPI000900DEC3|nr:PREDICTED: uncharacterized protein LOC109191677 [Ipomoea nil]